MQDLDTRLRTLEAKVKEHEDVIGQLLDLLEGGAQRAGQPQATDTRWTRYRPPVAAPWSTVPPPDDAWAEQLVDLMVWLEWAWPTVLGPHAGVAQLPECWPRHAGVVEELLALYAAWTAAHAFPAANTLRLAWHDGWVPGCMSRIFGDPYGLLECATAPCAESTRPTMR